MLPLPLAVVAAADFFQPVVQRSISEGFAVAVPPAWTHRASAEPRVYAQPRPVQGAARSQPSWLAGVVVFVLVERFDTEPYSDFSAKLANFIGLVLCCI